MSRDQLDRAAAARAAVVVPHITYPEQLPVSARREDIAAAIEKHQVVVVAGETGSGKTTQLPKILLDLGRGRKGQIGHTQPRRIAARSVAERVNEEINGARPQPLGGVVGYQVRFTDTSSADTLVKVMTDGILLAQIQRDPELLAYDTIIIDEAHERSLNIDFLLGYLSRLLPRRPDLKLIITSATIDSERFAAHFSPASLERWAAAERRVEAERSEASAGSGAQAQSDQKDRAPVIEVTGRTYPVEIRYRPLSPDTDPGKPQKRKGEEKDLVTGIVEACDELMREGPGDILVFLSGEREIHDAADALEGHLKERARDPKHPQHVEILPLYSRLSAAEQHRVFQQHSSRRIVLSTNVAETSLTVPGIHYVVDPGTARISRYSKATKVQRLPIEPISQASANQRSGRSGRVADGVAIRLYAQDDFESRPEFTEPEILRTSLASVLLQMISVGVVTTPDDVAKFPFVEPPDTRAVRDGVQLLTELGALSLQERGGSGTRETRLTDVGRTLAQLPMDPRLARMIIEGAKHGVAREVAIIAAALSIQDPRERPAESRPQADQMHARFTDPTSDFLTYLNLWEYLRSQQRAMGSSAFRRTCRAEYINFLRVREWQDVVAQLRQMSGPLGIDLSRPAREAQPADPENPDDWRRAWDGDTVHRSLLAGLLSQVGMQETSEVKASSVAHLRGETRARALRQAAKRARNEYLGARGARFAIFPGSPLSKKPPAWIMAGELVETSRLWARDVARIQPEWAEELAGDLAKRTYADPHWSTKQGAAMATEKVLLYGVPIVADRKVLFGRIDPVGARELFIRHALVEGRWTTHHRFFAENRRLLAEAEELEARSRQRGLVASEDDLFAFYDERVPASVVSARHFDSWWKKARHDDPDLLTFTLDQLVDSADTAALPEMFPESWTQGDVALPLTYQFQPGTDADGVTVHIPLSILNRVAPEGFDWMVPGLLDELCVATIRSLPKAVRRELVPAPDVGAAVAHWLRENTPTWEDMTRAGDMASPFHVEFSRAVRALRDVVIPDDVWDAERVERLPAHLRMAFRVEEASGAAGSTGSSSRDGQGRSPGKMGRVKRPAPVPLDESRDLLSLQKRLAPQAEAAVRAAVKGAVGVALEEAARAASASGSGPSGSSAAAGPTSDTPGRPSASVVPPSAPARPSQPGLSSDAGPAASAASSPSADSRPGHGVIVAEETGLSTWPSVPGGELPRVVSTDLGGGVVVQGYPALVEEPGAKRDAKTGSSVALRVLADAAAQDVAHERGVRRLLLTETALATARITSRWSSKQSLTLAAAPHRNTEALVADLQLAAVIALTSSDELKAPGTPTGGPVAVQIRDAETYKESVAFVRQHLEDEVHRIVGHVVAALSAWRTVEGEVRASSSLALLNTLQDIRDHVAGLIHDGFVSATPPRRVPHLVRYLRAASYRLEKAQSNPHRDAELAWKVHDVTEAYERARAAYASGAADPAREAELAEVRWLLEELRVSLFAQQLGTDGAVSEKRIRKILNPGGW
ncbi:ATP-dependent RNA helicase HrpA [Isoptericola halotolerans]